MPTFNEGIRTVEGENLFNRVKNGYTDIHYTRIVFSSLDLSGKSDNDISQLTDVQPQELSVKTQTVSDTQDDGETDIRAIATNEPLTAGVNINTYALYAMDDQKREVLFGVAVDNHPSYLPAHAPGEQIQYLTYDWTSSIKDTNKIEMTDPNDVIVTYDEFNRYRNSLASSANSYHNSLSASASGANSALSMSAEGGIDGNGQRTEVVSSQATSYTNSAAASLTSVINTNSGNASGSAQSVMNQANANMETNRANLQNSINKLPNWFDMNWTRNNLIPSGAASAANAANGYTNGKIGSLAGVVGANSANASSSAQSVMNQANANMENNRVSLSNSINGLPHWWDENWTRNNVAPSLANSARDAANGYTNQQAGSLTNRVNANENNILFMRSLPSADLNNDTADGIYNINGVTLKHAPDGISNVFGLLTVINIGAMVFQKLIVDGSYMFIRREAGAPASWDEWQNATTKGYIDGLQSQVNNLPTWNNENDTRQQASNGINNLQNEVNSLNANTPKWPDETYTRDQINTTATNAMNQAIATANSNMESNRSSLQGQINGSVMNIQGLPSTDLNDVVTTGTYYLTGQQLNHCPSDNDWSGSNPWGLLIVVNAGNMVFQKIIKDGSYVFIRRRAGATPTWDNWQNLTTKSYIDSLQSQVNSNNSHFTNPIQVDPDFDFNNKTQTNVYAFYGNENFNNGPMKNGNEIWGWLIVIAASGTVTQILEDSNKENTIFTRFGMGYPLYWTSWSSDTPITASNEADAQNQSNQHPGMLFIYND